MKNSVINLSTILIPVDFSLKTDVAIKKAADLSRWGEIGLHLLHVANPGHGPKHSFRLWEIEKEFVELQEKIQVRYPQLRVKTHILQGHSIQKMIIDCVHLLEPSLIIIGKTDPPRPWSLFRSISPDAIANKSNCPVLTVKPGSAESKTRVILLPVCNFVPERKLEWAILLARKYRAQVHLLAIQSPQAAKEWPLPQVFLRAYDLLRENLHQPIEYYLTDQQNAAQATLNYAKEIMADMIVVNPKTESSAFGIAGYRHLSDLLRRDSTIQVLDVEPYKMSKLSGMFPAAQLSL
ncbi:MAG TPA: universal stress protein [Puia sp.]|nr:universal stress protein [Puia sp.]